MPGSLARVASVSATVTHAAERGDALQRARYGDEGWSPGFADGRWFVTDGADHLVLQDVARLEVGGVAYTLVGGGAFGSIQAAISAASAGDTVLIAGGFYGENLILDGKAINLVAAGDSEVTIDPPSGTALTLQGDLGANNTVAIRGIDFTAADRGVLVKDGANLGTLEIDDACFSDLADWGVMVGEGNHGSGSATSLGHLIIMNSVFYGVGGGESSGNGTAVKLWRYQGDLVIEGTEFTGHPEGATTRLQGAPPSPVELHGVDEQHLDEAVSIGTVTFTDVTVRGGYAKSPVGIYNYSSHEGLFIVRLNQSVGTNNIFNGGQYGVSLQG